MDIWDYRRMTGFKELKERTDKVHADAAAKELEVSKQIEAQQKNKMQKPNTADYTGTYNDNWFGKVNLTVGKSGRMVFKSEQSPRMRGELYYYNANTFVVRWYDRSFDADAFVSFELNREGKANGFRIESFSPLTDFSFDFQDLDFKKINDK
jgi:hypothetical protein